MKIASIQKNSVLPLRQGWKVTLRPYITVCLKCKGDNMGPAKSLLTLVSLKETTRAEAVKTEHTGSYLCKKPQKEPSSPNCAWKETPFSSPLPLSCT